MNNWENKNDKRILLKTKEKNIYNSIKFLTNSPRNVIYVRDIFKCISPDGRRTQERHWCIARGSFRAKQGHLFVDHLSAGAKRTHGQPVTFDSVSIGPFVFAMFYYDVVRAYDACNIYIYIYIKHVRRYSGFYCAEKIPFKPCKQEVSFTPPFFFFTPFVVYETHLYYTSLISILF